MVTTTPLRGLDPLIGAPAVAAALGVKVRTVCHLAATGVLPAVRVGWAWRFDPEVVADAVATAADVLTAGSAAS